MTQKANGRRTLLSLLLDHKDDSQLRASCSQVHVPLPDRSLTQPLVLIVLWEIGQGQALGLVQSKMCIVSLGGRKDAAEMEISLLDQHHSRH